MHSQLASLTAIPDHHTYGPQPDRMVLRGWFTQSNTITRGILKNLQAGQEIVPQRDILNPPLWEFGHLTWFHEFWVQRKGQEARPSLLADADYLFNSSDIAHADRWKITLPELSTLLDYNQRVVNQTLTLLNHSLSPEDAYFIQLAIFHQDMHNEAFAYMWQTLGYARPFEPYSKKNCLTSASNSYIDFSESVFLAGSQTNTGFLFDNEKWQHPIQLNPFSISSHAVSNADYLEFVKSGVPGSEIPAHWKCEDGRWYQRTFDQWVELDMLGSLRHISYQDALRYCDWRGVRLPTEHEMTFMMSQDIQKWQSSDVWEWTSSAFLPFPGFSTDPYVDYSQPWFDGTYQVLKGWSAFTPERLRRPALRNFYQPHRSDHFCGFRTCLL